MKINKWMWQVPAIVITAGLLISTGGTAQDTVNRQHAADLVTTELAKLDERTVHTLNGQELGSVTEVVLRRSDKQLGFVVSVGGFFGIGATDVFVPASEVSLESGIILWQTRQPADQIIYFSNYDNGQYDVITNRFKTLNDARQALLSAQVP